MLEVLEEIALNKKAPAAARVAAANAVIDRAYGKPEQSITARAENPLAGYSFAERRTIIMDRMGIAPTLPNAAKLDAIAPASPAALPIPEEPLQFQPIAPKTPYCSPTNQNQTINDLQT